MRDRVVNWLFVIFAVILLFALCESQAQMPVAVRSHFYHALINEFEKHSGSRYWTFNKRRSTTKAMIDETTMDYGGEDMRVDARAFNDLARNLIGDEDVKGSWYAKEVKKTVIR